MVIIQFMEWVSTCARYKYVILLSVSFNLLYLYWKIYRGEINVRVSFQLASRNEKSFFCVLKPQIIDEIGGQDLFPNPYLKSVHLDLSSYVNVYTRILRYHFISFMK